MWRGAFILLECEDCSILPADGMKLRIVDFSPKISKVNFSPARDCSTKHDPSTSFLHHEHAELLWRFIKLDLNSYFLYWGLSSNVFSIIHMTSFHFQSRKFSFTRTEQPSCPHFQAFVVFHKVHKPNQSSHVWHSALDHMKTDTLRLHLLMDSYSSLCVIFILHFYNEILLLFRDILSTWARVILNNSTVCPF